MKRAKKGTVKSQTYGELFSSEPHASQLRDDLAKDKRLRKKLYKEIWKRWGDDSFDENEYTPRPCIDLINKDQNWQKACNLIKLQRSMMALMMIKGDRMEDIEEIYDWIWPKAMKYLLKKVYEDKLEFPMLNKTQAIREFIYRGFVHYSDFVPERGKFYIKTHIADLRYPKEFDQHQDAIEFMAKVGIPGYTQAVIPPTIKK